MSKSRGNVVNPDDVIAGTGADALRLYLMFMGPLEQVRALAPHLSPLLALAPLPLSCNKPSSLASVTPGTATRCRFLRRPSNASCIAIVLLMRRSSPGTPRVLRGCFAS